MDEVRRYTRPDDLLYVVHDIPSLCVSLCNPAPISESSQGWDRLNPIGKGSLVAKAQKVSTKEFKEEAVKLAQNRGKATAHIARELGVSESAISQWQKH